MADHEGEAAAADCGFCAQNSDVIDDCRMLPCEHIHCMACLASNFGIRKTLQCPLSHCRRLFNIDLDSLPQHTRHRSEIPCDVCMRKHEKESAVVYCMTCCKKYCTKHMQSHDDIMNDHPNILIENYRKGAHKFECRLCTIHTDLTYLRVCKLCLRPMCVECLCSPGACVAGDAHEMLQINELVQQLEIQTRDMTDKIIQREEQLSHLHVQATQVLADFETTTQRTLQTAKEQSMPTKYLLEVRSRTKTEIITFTEAIIEIWSTLNTCRLRADARLSHSHQVDVINGHRDMMREMQRLLKEELPQLRFEDVRLGAADGKQDGLTLTSYDSTFDYVDGLTTCFQLPKSMTLLRTINLPSSPLCVCHSEGNVYVGLQDGSVCRIDSNYELHEQFLRYNNTVADIVVYKKRIYTLIYGSPMEVHVNDLSGSLVTSWQHSDSVQWCNKLTIMADHLIVPDRSNKLLVVYSLSGKKLRKIQCVQLSDNWVAVCALRGSHSVVITDYESSVVLAVNVKTGGKQWVNRYTAEPLGVTTYGQNNLLVFNGSNRVFEVLDVHTGDVLLSFQEKRTRKSDVLDLAIIGNTMIVPEYQSKTLSFNELNNR